MFSSIVYDRFQMPYPKNNSTETALSALLPVNNHAIHSIAEEKVTTRIIDLLLIPSITTYKRAQT